MVLDLLAIAAYLILPFALAASRLNLWVAVLVGTLAPCFLALLAEYIHLGYLDPFYEIGLAVSVVIFGTWSFVVTAGVRYLKRRRIEGK